MKEIYFYIFFRIYIWNKYLWKDEFMASLNSAIGLSISFYSLLMVLVLLGEKLGLIQIFKLENYWIFISIILLIFIIHFLLFEKNKNYLVIEKQFSIKKKFLWYVKGFFVWSYALGSILLFMSLI